MVRIFSCGLMAMLLHLSIQAQRLLETVRESANNQFQTVAFAGKVLIAGHTDTYLLSYIDAAFTPYDYPLVGGVRLRFDSYKNPLTIYMGNVYMRLNVASANYLYRYNGFTFSRITIPGSMIGNCAVYGGYLYFMSDVSGTKKLYRYNGTSITEMATLPNSSGYQLHSTASYLYITGYGVSAGTVNFIRRYNGTSFFSLPYSGSGTDVQNVYQLPSGTRVYFTSHERILYYDGSTVTQVFYNAGETQFARLWRNKLYFTAGVGASPARATYLYQLNGATLTNIALPGGAAVAPVPHTNPEIFNDGLFIGAVYPDGTKKLLRYNEATFTSVFDITTSVGTGVHLFLREGSLIVHPNFVNGTKAYEYNGSTFTGIEAPAGRLLFPYMNSTACDHLWMNYHTSGSTIVWSYAREKKDCPPPPPPPMPVIVIPEHFKGYEHFNITTYGPDRGWCWSEIIIDWEVEPYCPLPPCPDPNYEMKMTDANNGVAWSQKFTKPGTLQVPLPDVQGYRTILSTPDNGYKDLIVFEPNLPEKGIATVQLDMKPKSNYFMLAATTKNNVQVLLKATLVNSKGAVLWEETFTAPFSKQITATVQEAGQKLIFSVPDLTL